MLKIVDFDFEMEQVKTSPFFELKLLATINEGKKNERQELKLDGHSMSFEACIDRIVSYRLYKKNISLSLNAYIEEYLKEIEILKNSISVIKVLKESELKEEEEDDDN